MKKLKSLNVIFSSHDEFMAEVKGILLHERISAEMGETISFDTIETFKRLMTSNKLELLIAIARLKPDSINKLAKLVNREFPHVLKDCRLLASLGFIKLEELKGAKKQLQPRLSFNYDVIRVRSKMEEFFPITEESNKILKRAIVS